MKITFTSYETAYNRHIRLARQATKETQGYERAEAIKAYFINTCHPHAVYTFDQMSLNRSSDHQFAIDLLKSLADLTAKNENGYFFTEEEGCWHYEALVGGVHFNDASVCRYSLNGDSSKQLITVEYGGKVHGYTTFECYDDYSDWVDFLMNNIQESGLNRMWQIANRLDPNWSANEE